MKKKYVILSMLIFALVLCLSILSTGYIKWFVDAQSFMVMFLLTVPILIIADAITGYKKAIEFVVLGKELTSKELKSSIIAIELAIKAVYLTSFASMVIGFISTLYRITGIDMMVSYLAIILITIFYCLLINLFQYGICARLKKELVYREVK